jgi:RES domain-containing protein
LRFGAASRDEAKHRFDPLTICAYNIDVDDIVDLRTVSGQAAEGIDLASMACAWAEPSSLATGEPRAFQISDFRSAKASLR